MLEEQRDPQHSALQLREDEPDESVFGQLETLHEALIEKIQFLQQSLMM